VWEDSLAPISWSHPHPTSLEFSGRGGGQVGLGGLLCSLIGLLQTPQVLFGLFFFGKYRGKMTQKTPPRKWLSWKPFDELEHGRICSVLLFIYMYK